MTTLDDLLQNFGLSETADGQEKTASVETPGEEQVNELLGSEKTASQGDRTMSLADMYNALVEADGQVKEAAAHASSAADESAETAAVSQELDAVLEKAASEELDREASIKIAAEYEAAGRIMARGFYDEMQKLAGGEDTHVVPGAIEGASQSKETALGPRGTDFQIPANHAGEGAISTAGGKQVYKDALKDGKSAKPGSGITMNPTVVGSFATVKDIAR